MLKEHGFVRVGCVVPELKIADIEFNVNEIIKQTKIASENKVQILCFPELSITGYSCADLFHQDILIEKTIKALQTILNETKDINTILIVGAPIRANNQLFNTAVVMQKGEILGIVPKTYIPNYQEFYESRWFTSSKNIIKHEIELFDRTIPFDTNILFRDKENKEICFGVEICEDLWVVNPPSNSHTLNGATMIFNLSASNTILGKSEYRENLVKMQSAKTISGYIYTSAGINESTSDLVLA